MRNIEILSSNGIDVEKGLELLGDIEMYDEILADFVEESEDRLIKLNNFQESSDMHNYAILVHAIKGDSGYLGFTELAVIARRHENESKLNNIEFVNNEFLNLLNELNRVIEVSKKYLN